MTDLQSVFRDDDDIQLAKPEWTWKLSDAAPEILAQLTTRAPLVPRLLEGFEQGLPVQRRWAFGETGVFTRPDRHVRALYVDLERLGQPAGAIAIKGGEAVCSNFDQIVDRLRSMWNIYAWQFGGPAAELIRDPGMVSALERFPVIEGKPPGVHPHWDATEEALAALELQEAYVTRYGELARAPVPLFVGRWPASVSQSIMRLLEPHLSPKAARTTHEQVSAGLGVYVYYYGQVPMRALHVPAPPALSVAGQDARMRALAQWCDPAVTVERWAELAGRILALGFVLADPANLNRGYCVQGQNMVLDGGFVDVNSLRRIETFKAEGEFAFSLMRSVQALAQAMGWFLVGQHGLTEWFHQHSPDLYVSVANAVRRHVIEAGRHTPLHPWLASAMGRDELYSDLFRSIRNLASLSSYNPIEQELDTYRREGKK